MVELVHLVVPPYSGIFTCVFLVKILYVRHLSGVWHHASVAVRNPTLMKCASWKTQHTNLWPTNLDPETNIFVKLSPTCLKHVFCGKLNSSNHFMTQVYSWNPIPEHFLWKLCTPPHQEPSHLPVFVADQGGGVMTKHWLPRKNRGPGKRYTIARRKLCFNQH